MGLRCNSGRDYHNSGLGSARKGVVALTGSFTFIFWRLVYETVLSERNRYENNHNEDAQNNLRYYLQIKRKKLKLYYTRTYHKLYKLCIRSGIK